MCKKEKEKIHNHSQNTIMSMKTLINVNLK